MSVQLIDTYNQADVILILIRSLSGCLTVTDYFLCMKQTQIGPVYSVVVSMVWTFLSTSLFSFIKGCVAMCTIIPICTNDNGKGIKTFIIAEWNFAVTLPRLTAEDEADADAVQVVLFT